MDNRNKSILVKTESELEEAIRDKKGSIALMYATWCPYCVVFLPVYQKYVQGRDDFLMIEDDQWVIADQYEVEVVPTALYFENGKVVKRLDGVLGRGLNEKEFVEFVKDCGL